MASAAKNSSADKSSPKTRSRANTIVSSKGILTTDDIKAAKHRGAKSKGTKVERSQTFLGKEEKKTVLTYPMFLPKLIIDRVHQQVEELS